MLKYTCDKNKVLQNKFDWGKKNERKIKNK